MSQDLESSHGDEDTESSLLLRFTPTWRLIALISFVLLIVSFNPLLTSLLPYLRAGWPSCRTGFWLWSADPWKARGNVGLLFHLCMAGFLAGVCGLVCIFVTLIAADVFKHEPDLVQLIIAIGSIMGGCALSFVFGWIGIVIALRNRVRIYVKSNLYEICKGDFQQAAVLYPRTDRTNPANFILAIATIVPALTTWSLLMLVLIEPNGKVHPHAYLVVNLLPVVAIVSIAIVMLLSARIIARSPADCWGVPTPKDEDIDSNWYQTGKI